MAKAIKPESDDAHLRETQVQSQQVYLGHFLDVRRDTVRLPNGHHAQREYIVHPGAVMVVPLLDDGRLAAGDGRHRRDVESGDRRCYGRVRRILRVAGVRQTL